MYHEKTRRSASCSLICPRMLRAGNADRVLSKHAMIINVLFVDDEIANLRNLQATLRPMQESWNIVFVSSGEEALQTLGKHRFDVIFTDLRMPGVDGMKLLTTVMNKYPHIVRFVMFDKADNEAVLRASSIAHQYLPKFSNLDAIKTAVKRAFALRDLLAGDDLKRVISQVRELPGLPEIYLQISKEVRSAEPSVKRVGELIEKDAGLSAKVLKMVHSAYYGLRQQVASPSHAVSLLGLDTIQSIVLFIDIFEQFDRIRMLVPAFSLEEFQRHSMTVSNYLTVLTKLQGLPQKATEEAAMIGLLHDTGKLVLAQNFPLQYNEALQMAQNKHIALWMAEWTLFGTTHAEVGAYLLGMWGISDLVVEACAFHHQPQMGRQTPERFIATLHVADAFGYVANVDKLDEVKGRIDLPYLNSEQLIDQLPAWRNACPIVKITPPRATTTAARAAAARPSAPPLKSAPKPAATAPTSFWAGLWETIKRWLSGK